MATKKITDLVEITTAASDDVLPIVDVSLDITNKITTTNLLKSKQDLLESGTNIKTINSTSLLGSGDVAVQETLVSGTNIKTINSTSLLGSGDISISANPSGGAGLIQFSDGSAFASDSNLFWDNTNKRLGVGEGTPTARVHVKGSGSTSATTSLLVQNSAGTELFKVNDVGDLFFNGLETSSMRIHTFGNINKGISIDNEIDMGAFSGITFKTWNGSAYSNFMRINGNTASRGLIIGGTTNDASANLQIDSTTQGVLFPRMTTTQKNAISSPASGLMVYDTDTNKLCCYNGTSWNDLF